MLLARHKSSYGMSSPSNITFIDAPEIGFMPAASHLLKNLTKPNIFKLSVKATDGVEYSFALSTI